MIPTKRINNPLPLTVSTGGRAGTHCAQGRRGAPGKWLNVAPGVLGRRAAPTDRDVEESTDDQVVANATQIATRRSCYGRDGGRPSGGATFLVGPSARHGTKIQLGEMIATAVRAREATDAEPLRQELEPMGERSAPARRAPAGRPTLLPVGPRFRGSIPVRGEPAPPGAPAARVACHSASGAADHPLRVTLNSRRRSKRPDSA